MMYLIICRGATLRSSDVDNDNDNDIVHNLQSCKVICIYLCILVDRVDGE